MSESTRAPGSGLPYALGTYLIWGLFPIYIKLLSSVPAMELVGWRILLTLPFCALVVTWLHQWRAVIAALTNLRTLGVLTLSAVFIGANWMLYIWAVQGNHVLAASLGYYINPLLNVLAGTIFLRERLSRLQWIAVALAGAGVAILSWGAFSMLWISLGLGLLFSIYGLLRKMAPVESLPGLTVETIVLMIPGALLVSTSPEISFGQSASTDVLLALAGVMTGIPLLLFAVAARRMDYSTLGFVQYLTPTLVFLQGLFLFREPIRTAQLASFGFIWAAIALFTFDLVQSRRRRTPPAA